MTLHRMAVVTSATASPGPQRDASRIVPGVCPVTCKKAANRCSPREGELEGKELERNEESVFS